MNLIDKRSKILKDCLNDLIDCTELIGEYLYDGERESRLETITKISKEYYEAEIRYDLSKATLDSTSNYFNNDGNDHTLSVDEVYKRCAKSSDTHIVPFEHHPTMAKIVNIIDNVSNKAQAANPNVSIEYTQSSQLTVDPITKIQLQNPWKNKVCGHVYEYKTILEYMKSKKSKPARCPYVGCPNANVQQGDLIEDVNLLSQIRESTQIMASTSQNSIQEID